jgi:excisionase family DNA binding protein
MNVPASSTAPPELPFHSVSEVVALTRMSRTWLYGEIRSGRLRSVMAGDRRMIPDDALAEWLASLPSGAQRSSGLGSRRLRGSAGKRS